MSDNERDSIEDEYAQDDDMDMDEDSKPSVKEKDSDREVTFSHCRVESLKMMETFLKMMMLRVHKS